MPKPDIFIYIHNIFIYITNIIRERSTVSLCALRHKLFPDCPEPVLDKKKALQNAVSRYDFVQKRYPVRKEYGRAQ